MYALICAECILFALKKDLSPRTEFVKLCTGSDDQDLQVISSCTGSRGTRLVRLLFHVTTPRKYSRDGDPQEHNHLSLITPPLVALTTGTPGPSTEQDSCSICRECMQEGQVTFQAPNCIHCFHQGCIQPWRNMGRDDCPNCRQPLVIF